MAHFLGLDWDQNQLHLVAATTDRTGMRMERALVWQERNDLTPASAEAAGRRLRERMKEAGIATAPVLACVGRDRVILKEVRFPPVPASEEPALVRFQASKDLTESLEEVILDYTPLSTPGPNGERQALVVIVRREVPAAVQALCHGAGLKLLGLAPRPFGVAATLQRATGIAGITPSVSSNDLVAVLTVGERWAELCMVRGSDLLFARALGVGPSLAGEVKRSLAVFGGQAQQNQGSAKLQALYVAGNGEHALLREQLHPLLDLPVHALDPFAREERVEVSATNRGGFTGIVGVVQMWSARQTLPINFLKPKEPRPVGNRKKQRTLVAAALAGILLLAGVVAAYLVQADRKAQVRKLTAQMKQFDSDLQILAPDDRDIKALKEWERTTISWLDEIYDLTVRFPHLQNLRIAHLSANPSPKKSAKEKDIYVGQLTLSGLVLPQDSHEVNVLVDAINRDPHCRATLEGFKVPDFKLKIDLAERHPKRYLERLIPPPPPPRGFPQPPPQLEVEDTEGGGP